MKSPYFTKTIRVKNFKYSKHNRNKKNHTDKDHKKCFDCLYNNGGFCKQEMIWCYAVKKNECLKMTK